MFRLFDINIILLYKIELFHQFRICIFFLYVILFKENVKPLKIFNDYSKFFEMKYNNKNVLYKPTLKYTYSKYIAVTLSNPCDAKNRNIQRYYRYNYMKNILFIYAVGIDQCMNVVYSEKEIFKDILFLNTRNHYFNITMLFLEAINWINMNLKYDYLIKWDVDIIVNIPLLFIFVNIQKQKLHYSGYLYNKTRVCRNKSRICYVPYSVYNCSYLPSFIASGLLILSNFASYKLDKYHVIYKSYMIRDDQYIGVIYHKLSIKPISINKYYIRVNLYNATFNIKSLLSYHTKNINELIYLYKLLYISLT